MCIIKENNKTRKKNLEQKQTQRKVNQIRRRIIYAAKRNFTVAKSNHDCTGADGGGVLSIYYAGTCNVMEGSADESLAYLFMPGLLRRLVQLAVTCYAILYQFWKVCVQIGKDNSFSKENAKCFRNISHFALLLAVVWFAGIVFLAILAVRQPGISIFMITAVLLSVMISVLTAALSHLILKAYELKQENELTI